MGANTFFVYRDGESVIKCFNAAVADYEFEYGHSGYTGTIAEKSQVTVVQREPVPYEDARILAQQLIERQDVRVDNKFGPAGAIRVKGGTRRVPWSGTLYMDKRGNRFEDPAHTTPLPADGWVDKEYDGWLFFGWASS